MGSTRAFQTYVAGITGNLGQGRLLGRAGLRLRDLQPRRLRRCRNGRDQARRACPRSRPATPGPGSLPRAPRRPHPPDGRADLHLELHRHQDQREHRVHQQTTPTRAVAPTSAGSPAPGAPRPTTSTSRPGCASTSNSEIRPMRTPRYLAAFALVSLLAVGPVAVVAPAAATAARRSPSTARALRRSAPAPAWTWTPTTPTAAPVERLRRRRGLRRRYLRHHLRPRPHPVHRQRRDRSLQGHRPRSGELRELRARLHRAGQRHRGLRPQPVRLLLRRRLRRLQHRRDRRLRDRRRRRPGQLRRLRPRLPGGSGRGGDLRVGDLRRGL